MTDHEAEVVIRPRRSGDLDALAAVLVEVHGRDGYPVEGVEDPRAWLLSDRSLGAWVATLDGHPVGQVQLTEPGPDDAAPRLWIERTGAALDGIAVLGRLFVSARARGHRLGERLTTTASDAAHEMGRRAVLDVMTKDQAARRTYERLGWKLLGATVHEFAAGQVAARAYVSPR